jgi:hypothetical protein
MPLFLVENPFDKSARGTKERLPAIKIKNTILIEPIVNDLR